MPSQRLKVIVTRRLPEVVETRLNELFDVELRDNDTPMSRAALMVWCLASAIRSMRASLETRASG